MKYFKTIVIILTISLGIGCKSTPDKPRIEEWKKEILQVETDFAQMAAEKGIPEAFLTFSAEDAVLLRNNSLTIGKDALRKRYANSTPNPNTKLTWKPDFIDVSTSGDMAYTYGQYIFTKKDSLGNVKSDTGIFHTVWKRQTDGSWKFVWD